MSDGFPDQPGPRRQTRVFMEGMADVTPDLPMSFEDLEAAALDALTPEAFDYVAGGAGGEDTVDRNREAFRRRRLLPRVLRDVSERDLSTTVCGTDLDHPVMLAPVGVQSIIHEEGERVTARAADDLGMGMVSSSAASTTMEDVREELGDAPGWFQLYWSADHDLAKSFVDRATESGYEALVVTLDTPMLAWRERDMQRAYLPFLDGEGVANYFSDPTFRDRLDGDVQDNELAAVKEFIEVFGDPTLTWDDFEWLCEYSDMPVVPKGILHPADAERAVEAGAAGVVVSNHGGRQVDGAVAALDQLPDVVDAVGDNADVLFDSGIRRGADALKALALGADAVLLGRPYVYGLALGGADGVREVCENFLADLDLAMGLIGCTELSDVDESVLAD
ncbi:alpha-hydroxy-acid oxidizing protein [Halorarum halophilum]|uniref:Alpha-hydroxy-acid oxidizing protein n=1 Tax=Halorarum halophilum TaxID=2743090 RepID=A0A7D5KN44_9EURY|nr:alpha-hydroxy-acid oxidizing protein [Halobaculum halophilum]QLG28202.1 alpha-hydroxy-acid oxidizing protein [Halobaculum halophilum]